jgi:uncharacterized cupin superfamily protein
MRVVNLLDVALEVDHDEPDGYRAPQLKVREQLGAERLASAVMLLRQGEAVCPYHYELAEEEWLLVLEGTPSVRTPEGTEVLAPGDVVCFPRGPEGAHKVFNEAEAPARVWMVSERAETAATVYEDSDKIGIYAPGVRQLFRRSDERDYFDGEGG